MQTNKNFTLGVIANEEHRDLISSTINEVCLGLNKERPSIIFFENKLTDYVRYVKKENINIQTRHDCDDWMCNKYVEDIQKIYVDNINKYNSFVIHVQPYKYNFLKNKKYRMSLRYEDNKTSMFASLCQRNCNESLLGANHKDIGKMGEKVFMLDEGSCHLVIHSNNKMSTLTNKDILIN